MFAQSTAVYESAEARELLARNGLADLDAVFEAAAGTGSRHIRRCVWRCQLREADGRLSTAFAKLSWGRRRLLPRMTDLRTGQALKSLPRREWEGLAALRRLGLRVPERLALLEDGTIWKRSATLLRAVPPEASLSELVRNGAWVAMPLGERRAILDTIAATLETIHAGGLGWRGASSRHFYPSRDRSGRWDLWLIDCEGVHRARNRAVLERDWKRFARSLVRDRIDDATAAILDEVGHRCGASRLHRIGEPGGQRAAA
jgi:hypothetical protein